MPPEFVRKSNCSKRDSEESEQCEKEYSSIQKVSSE